MGFNGSWYFICVVSILRKVSKSDPITDFCGVGEAEEDGATAHRILIRVQHAVRLCAEA